MSGVSRLEKDDTQAVQWYLKAAEQGEAEAQYNLGNKYGRGEGVEKDENEAKRWLQKAADQGHKGAQAILDKLAP